MPHSIPEGCLNLAEVFEPRQPPGLFSAPPPGPGHRTSCSRAGAI